MKFLSWMRTLLKIVKNYDSDLAKLTSSVEDATTLIKKRTEIHADIGYLPSENQIIVVGRYRNKDYIRVFGVDTPDFISLVEYLKSMEKSGHIGKVDTPIGFEAVVGREFKERH